MHRNPRKARVPAEVRTDAVSQIQVTIKSLNDAVATANARMPSAMIGCPGYWDDIGYSP